MNLDPWQLFTRPNFKLTFRYPDGAHLVATENPELGVTRVHLSITDNSALYFEVAHSPRLEAEAEYQQHKMALAKNLALENFSITDLQAAQFGSRLAYKYAFSWGQRSRAVVLVPQAPALYRLLYDPFSDLNEKVLSTIEFTD